MKTRFCLTLLLVGGLFLPTVACGQVLHERTSGPGVAIQNGDTNGDGRRDLPDVVQLLIHCLRGGPAPVPLSPCGLYASGPRNGDTNGDGRIDVADAIRLLQWLRLGGPPPTPACSGTETVVRKGRSSRPWRDPVYDVRVTHDIQYGEGEVRLPEPGFRPLLLDLYEPVGATVPGVRRPTLLLLPGGSFIYRKRGATFLVDVAMEMAARGYVVLEIDYRVVPDDPVPSSRMQPVLDQIPITPLPVDLAAPIAAIDDALTALDWIMNNSADLRLDTERLGLMGSSAGAVTCLHTAYVLDSLNIAAPPVRVVGDFWGGIYFPLGDPIGAANQLEAGEPPLFIVHGALDAVVPVVLSDLLAARAQEVGVPFVYHRNPDGEHGFATNDIFVLEAEPGLTIFERLVEFVYAAMFKPGCLQNSQGDGQGNTCDNDLKRGSP